VEAQTITSALYTLTDTGDRLIIRRPSGAVAFRVKRAYAGDAYELLANLNAKLTPDGCGDDD
jgi:hypothetical protein